MPSVKLALDHVNEHSDILSNYRLHMWWNDTQVNITICIMFETIEFISCMFVCNIIIIMKLVSIFVISVMQRSA